MLLDEVELKEIQKAARRSRMTVAEWVRRALRDARKEGPVRDRQRKLDVIRQAVVHEFPAGRIEDMLDEIERGYLGGDAA